MVSPDPQPASSLAEFRQTSKAYSPSAVALDSASLVLAPGRYIVVVGPSGCGKTTLLRLIAGLESPTSGTILLEREDASRRAPHTRPVALAAQGAPLYPHLSVLENLGFAARARGTPAATVRSRVDALAAALDITSLLSRRPGELSGGQRQRVALGRALVQQAPITLLDEPLAALEPEMRGRVGMLLRGQQRETRGLFIHVTHDHEEAVSLADELIVMHAGRIRQHAPTQVVLETPADRFVAEFLAEPRLNAFEGRLERGDAGVRFIGPGIELAVPGSAAPTRLGDAVMTLAPDAILLSDAAASRSDGGRGATLRGTVADITRRAGRVLLHVRVGQATVRAFLPPGCTSGNEPAIGTATELALNASKARFFEPGPAGARLPLV